MSEATLSRLSKDVSVIDICASVDLDGVLNSHVFVRSMYSELLRVIRAAKRTVLIGNPGTSTSFFHYYYMTRLLKPALFEALPPDWRNSTAAPTVVVRQTGHDAMTIYDLTALTADEINGAHSCLLECFDPQSTLYLHEPRATVTEPLFYRHGVPVLTTTCPDRRRYKELVKSGAAMVFMPTYTQEELVTIGNYLQEQGAAPKGVSYSENSVKVRFKRYGGIFRHVLPIGEPAVRSTARYQKLALECADAGALLRCGDIESPQVSSFLAQYRVQRNGNDTFLDYSNDIASKYIVDQLMGKFSACSLEERRHALVRNDDTGFMETACEKLYAGLLADSLTASGGVTWRKRRAQFRQHASGSKSRSAVPAVIEPDWEVLALSLKRVERSVPPRFADMEEGVVYHPTDEPFPAVDFIFKSDGGALVGIKVTRKRVESAERVKAGEVLDLLERLGLSAADANKLELVLVPHPNVQGTAELALVDSKRAQTGRTCPPDESALASPVTIPGARKKKEKVVVTAAALCLQEYTVWGIPPDYRARWARYQW
jgi:hypothetical protein